MHKHERWLSIAQEDLLAAKGLIKLELYSSTVYHCQQTIEKALKAYLAFKNHPLIKTHDLRGLLELCMSCDQEFAKQCEAIDYINQFATRFASPTEFDLPTQDEAQCALKHAKSILHLVRKKISEVKPGQIEIQ